MNVASLSDPKPSRSIQAIANTGKMQLSHDSGNDAVGNCEKRCQRNEQPLFAGLPDESISNECGTPLIIFGWPACLPSSSIGDSRFQGPIFASAWIRSLGSFPESAMRRRI